MAAVVRSPPKCFPIAADACRALLFPTRNMGGVCFCAPTRTSDNGRRCSFAPEMFFDCGGYLSGAIVLGHEHGGAYAIRPYTDVRRRRLTFIRPRNVFRLRRMPVRRYCSRPGNIGGVCNTPLHGRSTMAAVVHSPPKCFPMCAPDAHWPVG